MPPLDDLVLFLLPGFPSVGPTAPLPRTPHPPSARAKYHRSARPALSQSPLLTHVPRTQHPPSYSVLTAGEVTCSGRMWALVPQVQSPWAECCSQGPSHQGPRRPP